MRNQCIRLCRLQLKNLFGINEFLHEKDKKRKRRFLLLAATWTAVFATAAFYAAAYTAGLIRLGMAEIVPLYLYAVASVLILVLTFFKAGGVLFQKKGYEMLTALPVPRGAVIMSRLFGMYLTGLLACALILLPGIAVYGYFIKPGIGFYAVCLISAVFLPLLPLTVSSVLGAGITALSARAKHKAFREAALMLALAVAAAVGSLFFSGRAQKPDIGALAQLTKTLALQMKRFYPPAGWFAGALSGDIGCLALLLLLPAIAFAGFFIVLERHFQTIYTALNAVSAKNNYRLKALHAKGKRAALWKRELKRYFASSSYMANTAVGYVLAVLAAAAFFFTGGEQLEAMLGAEFGRAAVRALPFAVSFLFSLCPMTAVSVSLEGKELWRLLTLPVRDREVYDGKISAALTVAAPFYFISVILLEFAVKPALLEGLFLALLPAAAILFTAVAGLAVNLALPVLNWENEVQVVKQSAATLVAMLIGMAVLLPPAVAVVLAGEGTANLIKGLALLFLLLATKLLYERIKKKRLADCIA